MKNIVFSIPILALGIFLAYCTKPAAEDTLPAAPVKAVGERAVCKLEVWTDSENTVQLCGTNTNTDDCKNCDATADYTGVELVSGGFGTFDVNSPLKLAVTNLGASPTYIKLDSPTSGSSTGFILYQPGECREFFLDDNCIIQ
jgi:hypothetical protein